MAFLASSGYACVERGGTDCRRLRTQYGRLGVVTSFAPCRDIDVGMEFTAGPGCVTSLVASVTAPAGVWNVVSYLAIGWRESACTRMAGRTITGNGNLAMVPLRCGRPCRRIVAAKAIGPGKLSMQRLRCAWSAGRHAVALRAIRRRCICAVIWLRRSCPSSC